jgi:hypothetical protein
MSQVSRISFGSYFLYEHDHIESLAADAVESTIEVLQAYVPGIEAAFGLSRAAMEARLSAGDTCFVLREEQHALGMMWGHLGSCYVRGVGLPIVQDNSTVYFYWVVTVPTARGRRVFTRLSAAFFRYYVDKGAEACSAIVETRNTIMGNAMRRMGLTKKTKLAFFKIGQVSLIVTTDLATMARRLAFEPGNRGGWDVI